MNAPTQLTGAQVDALASIHRVLGGDRWALIGASAIGLHLPMPRPTFDLDFAVAASGESVHARLRAAQWERDPKQLQRWVRAGAFVDVVPASDEDLLAGVAILEDGFQLSVIGFDLAFERCHQITIRDGLSVPVPRLSVLVLLKMIAWLDRPSERIKDLEDIFYIWTHALPELDDRRWDAQHAVGAAALDSDDQSPFFVGWELGQVAALEHLHWAKRFLEVMSDDGTVAFAQLVRASRYFGDDDEDRVKARLAAFARGLELGAMRAQPQPPASTLAPEIKRPTSVSVRRPALPRVAHASAEMRIHDAIDQRRVIQFYYGGKLRVAAPHVLGVKNGRLQVLTWQIGGASSSSPLPGWRRFFVDELSGLETTTEAFAGPRLTHGRHSAFDRHIAVVRW